MAGSANAHDHDRDGSSVSAAAYPAALHQEQAVGEPTGGNHAELDHRADDIIRDGHSQHEHHGACHLHHEGGKVSKQNPVQIVEARVLPAVVVEPKRAEDYQAAHRVPGCEGPEGRNKPHGPFVDLEVYIKPNDQCNEVGKVHREDVKQHHCQTHKEPSDIHKFVLLFSFFHKDSSKKILRCYLDLQIFCAKLLFTIYSTKY